MSSYNHGKPVAFDNIKDYEQAAKDFAEGNKDLENLLLSCFHKKIQTRGCCADGGHTGKDLPFISFLYTEENIPYLLAILSKLKDKGYSFDYMQNPNSPNTFIVQEKSTYTFQTPTSLFQEINEIILDFNPNRDYYEELPIDLKKYIDIIKIAKNNSFLNTTKGNTKIHVLGEGFRLCYKKNEGEYGYAMLTKNNFYNKVAEITSFKKVEAGWCSYYLLQVKKREDALFSLNKIASYTEVYAGLDTYNTQNLPTKAKIISNTEKQLTDAAFLEQLSANIDIQEINSIYHEENERRKH